MEPAEPARSYCRCGARLARDNAGDACGPCQRRARELAAGAPAVPSEFWESSQQLRDALDAWHMGRVIAAYRAHPHHGTPLAQEVVAGWVGLTQTQLSRIESGAPVTDLAKLTRWAEVLRIPAHLLWFKLPGSGVAMADAPGSATAQQVARLERLRQRADDNLTAGTVTVAALEEWEAAVRDHGTATRYRPASLLLADLAADFTELQRTVQRRQPPSTTRQLTRATAQIAGLISLTLVKLGERGAARAWGRTARLAATEAGDTSLACWVRAQDAYTFFYSGGVREAVGVAREAQAIAGRTRCVGAVLSAALEARAHAVLGQADDAKAAMDRAEVVLLALNDEDVAASAFGYNEAQLRFHQGNALTHLGNGERAWEAQQRALALYPAGDYLDRALVHLDRADCLMRSGEVVAGVTHATGTVLELAPEQRDGLILERARELARAVAPGNRGLPAVRQLREVLALPGGTVGRPA